jgi:hypothetical protein
VSAWSWPMAVELDNPKARMKHALTAGLPRKPIE